jgi:hypothetical protein
MAASPERTHVCSGVPRVVSRSSTHNDAVIKQRLDGRRARRREQQRQQVGAAIRGGRMASCAAFVVGVVDARIRSHERFDNRRRVERHQSGRRAANARWRPLRHLKSATALYVSLAFRSLQQAPATTCHPWMRIQQFITQLEFISFALFGNASPWSQSSTRCETESAAKHGHQDTRTAGSRTFAMR